MDIRGEVRDFLVSRRARLTPREVGLPDVGQRRVAGLRRGEVAVLAGVSVEYYSRLERGTLAGASSQILDSIATALRLDEAERTHLFNLARAQEGPSGGRRPRPRRTWTAHPTLQWVLDAITGSPAIVRNGRMDLLAWNALGRAMHSPLFDRSTTPTPNFARFTFLDDGSRDFYPDWDRAADISVSLLHTEAGRDPHDRHLHDLVGELSTLSPDFARRWSAHNVHTHGAGTKRFHHPVVGELVLAFESVEMVSEPGLNLTIYAAEPGSRTAEAVRLLASWASTELAEATHQGEGR